MAKELKRPTEITLVIYDPRGRDAEYWYQVVVDEVEDRDAEIADMQDEEV